MMRIKDLLSKQSITLDLKATNKMSAIDELVDLHECPLCEGGSILEEEGNGFYAQCMDCGCYTVHVDYKNEEDRLEAAKRAAELFNTGKVLKSNPGE